MDTMMIAILAIGGGAVLVLLVVGIAVTARSERSLVEERIGRYLEKDQVEEKKAEKSSPVGDWLDKRIEKSKVGGGLARELARADLKLKPTEFVLTMLIAALGVGFIFWFFSDRNAPDRFPFMALVGAFLGLFLPRIYLKQQQTKRLRNFSDQLADMLNLMVNGLRAGYSTMQAMEAVSREMPTPISDEFRRVVQEMQLGLNMDTALDNLLRRIPSDDLDLVITAMSVQREVGGNLAEILDTISYTIRERVRIKGEIRVLTSQVMYSGRFLSMMPLIIAAILWFLNPEYMMQFFNPETRIFGIAALIVAALMIGAGYFAMTRIASIEV